MQFSTEQNDTSAVVGPVGTFLFGNRIPPSIRYPGRNQKCPQYSDLCSYAHGWDSDFCFNSTKQGDGLDCGVAPFYSAIINGKGKNSRVSDEKKTKQFSF